MKLYKTYIKWHKCPKCGSPIRETSDRTCKQQTIKLFRCVECGYLPEIETKVKEESK